MFQRQKHTVDMLYYCAWTTVLVNKFHSFHHIVSSCALFSISMEFCEYRHAWPTTRQIPPLHCSEHVLDGVLAILATKRRGVVAPASIVQRKCCHENDWVANIFG